MKQSCYQDATIVRNHKSLFFFLPIRKRRLHPFHKLLWRDLPAGTRVPLLQCLIPPAFEVHLFDLPDLDPRGIPLVTLMKKNDEVLSLEQMRILLHISKRKAAWMLQNQVIPCIVNDQMTTRKYMVRREDVEAFLRLPAAEQQARIPVGQFTSGYQCKPVSNVYAYSIPDTERDRFTLYLDDLFSDKPNALTINMACC